MSKGSKAKQRRETPLATPTDLGSNAMRDVGGAMNAILADVFVLYLKTKNFYWHLSGPHFRDYHLMLDEQGNQLFGMTDPIAGRIRKIGAELPVGAAIYSAEVAPKRTSHADASGAY